MISKYKAVAVANRGGAMEADTISKKRADPEKPNE